MESEIVLTGIVIGYDNNLIYECSKPDVIEEFKAYLEPSEVSKVDVVNLWLEVDKRVYFLKVKPEKGEKSVNSWVVTINDVMAFKFNHMEGKNLYDEIRVQFGLHEIVTEYAYL
jgi:hypothetical protein